MSRTALPSRRRSIHVKIVHGSHEFTAGFGFGPNGTVKEIFCWGTKTGTDMQATITDAAILISILLQYGVSAGEIADAMGENRAEGQESGPAASIIGTLARQAAEIDSTLWTPSVS